MTKDQAVDSRFEGVNSDPRFKRPSVKKSKTVIDSRFKRILTDEKFKSSSSVDPRGISARTPEAKKPKTIVNEELKRFYELEEDTADDVNNDASAAEDDGQFEWNAESSSDEDDYLTSLPTAKSDDENDEDVPLGDSTERIAVMNCNWDHVGASDIFILLQSFLDANAPGRKVMKVTVHKSDFGAERMEREEMYGPMIEGMPSDNEDDDSLKTKAELAELEEKRNIAVRNYERTKRRYFFAIAEFDSINTACIVYDELEGVCGGFVSEALDLRFVPDDTPDPSAKRPPVSQADHVPADYTPPLVETGNLTMDHSKVKCSWDEDPPERKILMKKLTPAQIADMDLDAYLESASDEEDAVDFSNLRSLLGVTEADSTHEDEENEEEPMGDMEMSFSRAVESVGKDVSKRLSETGSLDKNDESQWEKYLAKRKEAKKQKKLERRQQLEQQKMERQASARANNSAAKKLQQKEGARSSDDEAEVDTTEIANDSRLSKLFKDPRFAVDPTHPSYKKTSVVNKLRKKKN